MRDLERDRPALAHRLEQVVDRLKAEAPEPAGHLSTGGAAAALDVSVNTARKWVRLGFIRDFWTLPGTGYLKIARSEVERIKAKGMPRQGARAMTGVRSLLVVA